MASSPHCERCPRSARYRFTTSEGVRLRCLRHAVGYGPLFRRAVRVALVVGTILFAINQADIVLRGDATPLVYAKSALTYLVPYCVSTFSALQINRMCVMRDA